MAEPAPALSKRKRKPWWVWVLLFLLVFFVLGFLFGRDAVQAARATVARRYANAASANMEKEQWPEALQNIHLARRWAADDPAVLRVLADFMIHVKGDAFALHHLLVRLADSGLATGADRLRIAEFQLTQGDVARARATLQALPEVEQRQRRAQELLANILRVEGRIAESEATMRRALTADANDPGARLRLALLDYQTPFPEVRLRARDRIREIAQGADDAALQALRFLSDEATLSASQAEQLLTWVEKHPKRSPAVRFRVLSALMRVQPASRAQILQSETAKFDAESPDSALLQWLIDEHEYDRLLSLLSKDLGKSESLFEFRLKALSGAGRWEEVEKLLSDGKELPLPTEVASLWRAKASHHLKRDTARTQQHLLAVYAAAGQGEKGEITLEAARFAEECGLWRVAATCYQGIARAHPTAQIRMLEKVHEMALRDRNSAAALQSARHLAEQNPANSSFAARQIYLQLIMGEEMEVAIARNAAEAKSTEVRENLLRALAAYRLGDMETMNAELAVIAEIDRLSPGERAVYAGLLAVGGKPGPAFQIAEKIQGGLLLPEEMAFLKRAL
ncbi:MAG TPA: hypothetical protein VD994_06010 [Prosthecobacter sp.]|nr:hypothetical protein [Prosthecobacter sp.]